MLRSVYVVNPHAPSLDFASHVTRTRRDHKKFLTMIRAVTLLFQHQRPLRSAQVMGQRVEYIESTEGDVELGTRLAQAVLGRGLDELPPQTRKLLDQIGAMVHAWAGRERTDPSAVRFTQRNVREWTHMGQTQLKLHMRRLEEHEYLRGYRGRGSVTSYELTYYRQVPSREPAAEPATELETGASGRGWSERVGGWSGGGRVENSQKSGGGRGPDFHVNGSKTAPECSPGRGAPEIT